MILGYDMFRNLASGSNVRQKKLRETFEKCLVNPGGLIWLYTVCSALFATPTLFVADHLCSLSFSIPLQVLI